ncbi:MAG: hydrogenase iron-sulfur subunit [Deltaproteobacteria bacterium]|nr:hydrogenase iron-sulfur subunit [Deltaproteobacteria bacterium]MBW2137578.1 hydrogenase iron-sulfur subunit [Deltaproteobacteria bacterium]
MKKGMRETNEKERLLLALFYCQNVPDSGEGQRQGLEKEYGGSLRLFPVPCSGRVEPQHLLRALEEFADAAYVITCPEGACRYFEGNLRARKRVERTRDLIAGIGLERERIGILALNAGSPKTLSEVAKDIMSVIGGLGFSPVFQGRGKGREGRKVI